MTQYSDAPATANCNNNNNSNSNSRGVKTIILPLALSQVGNNTREGCQMVQTGKLKG